MSECTWEGCANPATVQRKARDGEVWAELCNHHAQEEDACLDAAIAEPSDANIRRVLGGWVKSMGGAKKATRRILTSGRE